MSRPSCAPWKGVDDAVPVEAASGPEGQELRAVHSLAHRALDGARSHRQGHHEVVREEGDDLGAREVKHLCHARKCNVGVPPRLLMCRRHWFMVPRELRARVWATYVPGQEITKTPTLEYLDAANAAIKAVAEKEGLN